MVYPLQYIQNSAVSVLIRTKKSSHISCFLYRLHWLPISFHIQYKIVLITFKELHGFAPQYISNLIHTYTRTLSCSESGLLLVPWYKLTSFGGRAFCTAPPTLEFSFPAYSEPFIITGIQSSFENVSIYFVFLVFLSPDLVVFCVLCTKRLCMPILIFFVMFMDLWL